MAKQNNIVFQSFFLGGFECASHVGLDRKRRDLLAQSRHDVLCREDYKRLKEIGITTVREGLIWSSIDLGRNKYDFARFETMMKVGQEEGIEQIWDLNHFDYPEYLDPYTERFVYQFARYAQKAIKLIRKHNPDRTLYIVPINEISFWAHMGGMIGVWAPHKLTRGYQLKQQLVRASIAAMDAIWKVDSNVRFIQVDPIFMRTAKKPVSIVKKATEDSFREIKFQAFDMLSGKLKPELGGHPKYLDIIGVNYYLYNQEWITGDDPLDESCHELIPWNSAARVSLATMLLEVYSRYHRPMIVTETGAWGEWREKWWKRTLKEIDDALTEGLPVYGVCAYPIIDRHDWDDGHLTNSGFWDFSNGDRKCGRVAHQGTINIVRPYIEKWGGSSVS